MPRKEKLEDMIAKLDKLNAKIDKNDSEMKPVRESRDALKKRVDAEMDRIKIERYTQIAEASLELFGWDISAKEYKEMLKREQAEREKAKNKSVEQNKNANNSPEVSPALDENVPADKSINAEVLPASVKDVLK